jgi:hypothetical protein
MRNPALYLTAVVVIAVALAVPAAADDEEKHEPVYTRVALWQVDRGHWGAFVEMFETYDKPILEKMFANGQIVEWGMDSESLHEPDGWTHATYLSATSVGALEKAMAAYDEAWTEMAGERLEELDTKFADMITKHRDYLTQSRMWSSAASFEDGYWRSMTVKVPREKDDDFHSYWDNRVKGVYKELLERGTIVAFGMSTEEIVTEEPGWHTMWYVTPSADGMDAVEAAFDADWGELDEEGRRARWVSIMDTIEEGSFRSNMSNIHHYQVKAH